MNFEVIFPNDGHFPLPQEDNMLERIDLCYVDPSFIQTQW